MNGAAIAVAGATGLDGMPVDLVAVDGVITEVGSGVAVPEGAELIDGSGKLLSPPLVNGHTHSAMTLFRSRGDDLPLMRWLEEVIWPVESELTPEDVYWGTRMGCVEMARNGVARFWDTYWHSPAVARAVADAGLRAVVGPNVVDPPAGSGASDEWLEDLDHAAAVDPRVGVAVAPHAIYTVGVESLARMSEVAAERNLPVHIHLSETRTEVENCLAEHGERPAFLLDRLGLLGPRTVLAHGVWLDRGELELIAERGATVVTNPVANHKLSVGAVFPYADARRAGVSIGLGTDGPASNNSLDPISDLKVFALAQRLASDDAGVLPVEEGWEIATGQRSDLLGGPSPLTPGRDADFVLIDLDSPEMATGDPVSNLVYTATGSCVDTLVVAGRVIARGREVEGAGEVMAKAREVASRLGG